MKNRKITYIRTGLLGLLLLLISGSLCMLTAKSAHAIDIGALPAITFLLLGSSDEVVLGPGGKLYFPEGGLPAGTTVTVQRAIPPMLTGDFIAVGSTYRVTADNQPTLPVKVTLPVPPGEDPDKLILVRFESHGRITLLQTQVENGQLVAWTPGLSDVTAASTVVLNDIDLFPLKIVGPDFLPINKEGQYTETIWVERIPFTGGEPVNIVAWPLEWEVLNYGEMGLTYRIVDSPLRNNRLLLSAEQPGRVYVTLKKIEPFTGLEAQVTKIISIVSELDTGDRFDLNVSGPNIVKSGELFNLETIVLNTDINRIVHWSWRMGRRSDSCDSGCPLRFEVNDNYLINTLSFPRNEYFDINATSDSGTTGSARHTITVLDTKIKSKINLSSSPPVDNDGCVPWDGSSANITLTINVEVIDGLYPPYTYEYHVEPVADEIHHFIYQENDSFETSLDSPGSYSIWGRVTNNLGEEDYFKATFCVKGGIPKDFNLTTSSTSNNSRSKSAKSATVNRPVQATLEAWGGVMYLAVGHCPDYLYWIDWGDRSGAEYGQLASMNPETGASIDLSHTYTAAGSYTIKYYAIPKGCRETPFNTLVGQNYSGLPFKSVSITVEEPPTDDYVVWYMDNVRCWDAPRVYATHRDGFNREEDTCDIPGGGINCDIKVEKVEMQGGFTTLETAQEWFCSQITTNWFHYWCNNRGPRVELNDGSLYTLQIPCDLSGVPFEYP